MVFFVRFILAVICLTISPLLLADKTVIRVASIDWCPQLCPEQSQKGYILDLVQSVFADSDFDIHVEIFPWSRALTMVKQGRVDAVLSPAKAEAPDLRYPQHEVGMQRMCFFTLKTSTWRYMGVQSLKGKQFGLAADTSLEELNDYTLSNPDQFQYQPYHERYILQQAKKIDRGRIDAFLFTYNSTIFELNKNSIGHKYKSAGCVSNANVYMAFSPAHDIQDKISKMLQHFDERMKEIKKTDQIAVIMQKYGLVDWRLMNE